MNKIVKNALVLMAFSLVLGFALGAVYKITEPVIAEATLRKEMAAYKVVFENADTFNQVSFDEAAAAKFMEESGFADTINKVFVAVDANANPLGYVVQLTSNDCFTPGALVMVVGITNDGIINGYSVTTHGETLSKAFAAFESPYKDQFNGLTADEVSNVSTISGATVTSGAVIRAVKAAAAYANTLGGAQ